MVGALVFSMWGHNRCHRMAVIRIARQCFGVQGELAAFFERCSAVASETPEVACIGKGKAHAFTSSAHAGCIVEIAAELALSLLQSRRCLLERPFEDRLELRLRRQSGGRCREWAGRDSLQLGQRCWPA